MQNRFLGNFYLRDSLDLRKSLPVSDKKPPLIYNEGYFKIDIIN